jgi:ferritin
MLPDKMTKAINEQVNAELYSGYLYLSMAAWFATKGLSGFENWMKIQAMEETTHAMKFFNHVNERGARVELLAIERPPTEWQSPLDAMRQVAEHEAHVTSLINNLVSMARDEKDFASENFLQWYVAEQVEEEATAADLVGKLELVDGHKGGLFMLDRELGQRSFVYPPPALQEG